MRYIPLSITPLPPEVGLWAYYNIDGVAVRCERATFLCLGEVIDEAAPPAYRRIRSLYPVIFDTDNGEWIHPSEAGDNFAGFDGPRWTRESPPAEALSQDADAAAKKP